jgi:hypothetical protein
VWSKSSPAAPSWAVIHPVSVDVLLLFIDLSADIVSERIQSLSKKEFALEGPMDIGLRMSEDNVSADLHTVYELSRSAD